MCPLRTSFVSFDWIHEIDKYHTFGNNYSILTLARSRGSDDRLGVVTMVK